MNVLGQGSANFFLKGQLVNILGVASQEAIIEAIMWELMYPFKNIKNIIILWAVEKKKQVVEFGSQGIVCITSLLGHQNLILSQICSVSSEYSLFLVYLAEQGDSGRRQAWKGKLDSDQKHHSMLRFGFSSLGR